MNNNCAGNMMNNASLMNNGSCSRSGMNARGGMNTRDNTDARKNMDSGDRTDNRDREDCGCMTDKNRMDGMNNMPRMNRMDGMNNMPRMNRAGGMYNMPGRNNMNRMSRPNMSAETSVDKRRIMMNVYELGFIMTETLLYLDTHPDDAEALAYFNEMRPRYQEAVAMYEKHCGPLNFTGVESDKYWTWVATPMPWEREGC